MRHRSSLPLLAFALACGGDATMLQPDDALGPERPSARLAVGNPAQGGWSFDAVATLTGIVDPGDMRITPGNVLHWTGLVTELALTGDLEGWMYFTGYGHTQLGKGDGPVNGSVLLALTAPAAGSFDCQAHGYSESFDLVSFPGADFTQSGHFKSCVGSRDFEADKLKGTWAFRPGSLIADVAGTIY